MFQLESPRLLLREITPDDAQFAYDLNSDPEVIRYTGDEAFPDIEAARSFLTNYDQYQRFGYGRWLVLLKENSEPIGWCGLKNQMEELGIIDLGYRFFRKHWGNGYATEASIACLDWGFYSQVMTEITARVAIGNTASENVIRKLGFEFEKMVECAHDPANQYKLSRAEWVKKRP